jgi:hypothetical protein
MAQKIIISKAGYNAITELDQKNLIFSSDLNHLKNKIAGSFSQSLAANAEYTETVAHGLGAVHPLSMAYFRDTSTSTWLIALTEFGVSAEDRKSTEFECEIYSDTTNVYIKVRNHYATTKTIEVQYEIFYENA